MSTNQSDKETWRKFLGIKDPSAGLKNRRVGGAIGRTAGRSGGAGGGGSLDADSVPEGEDGDSAEKGDGAADAGKQLKPGDKADRLEDLYDCETGEEVTIDGIGGGGSQPSYPTGFNDCKEQDVDPSFEAGYYWLAEGYNEPVGGYPPVISSTAHQTKEPARSSALSLGGGQTSPPNAEIQKFIDGTTDSVSGTTGGVRYLMTISRKSCSTDYNQVCDLPPPKPKWPAVDKNHLTWNKEKGCFEPLCPELNNQVLDKYKTCEKERILCDKDGNKVKVTVDGDTVKVTQAKYNQTAEIKNGKVQSVKQLTESQTAAEFK